MPTLTRQFLNVTRRAHRRAAAAALLILGGCQTPAPVSASAAAPEPAAEIAAPPEPAQPGPPTFDEDRLDALLEQGDRAFADDRLLTPIDDCAYDYYREALKVAPGHPAPLHGLGRVADRYIALADQAAQRGQYDTARSMLERARIVDSERTGIEETDALIGLRSTAKRQQVILDGTQLSRADPTMKTQLKRLGARIKASNTWVIIRARSDAEGRWIYQQLAQGGGDRRIRAELVLGSPPAIDVLVLDESH